MTKKNLAGVFLISSTLFLVELAIMVVFDSQDTINPWLEALLDALVITVLSTVFVQLFYLMRLISLPGKERLTKNLIGWRSFFSGTTVIGAKFAFSIFAAESAIMLLLPALSLEVKWFNVLDATLLALLCGPISYFWLTNTLKLPKIFSDATQNRVGMFLLIFIPSLIIVSFLVMAFSHTETINRTKNSESNITHNLSMIQKNVLKYFNARVFDVVRLSQQLPLISFLENDPWSKKILFSEYQSLLENTSHYFQIRFIDENGQEIIHADQDHGLRFFPDSYLQNKKHRYYFKNSINLNQDSIYISKLDLNIENKKIEIPYKPVVRIAAPVFDKTKHKRGIVIVNVHGSQITEMLQASHRTVLGEQLMLLNQDGYWLYGANEEDLWGFHFSEKKGVRFAVRFPDVWTSIQERKSGQLRTEQGLFTFNTLKPNYKDKHIQHIHTPMWTLVSFIPKHVDERLTSGFYGKFLLLLLCLVMLLGVVSWNLSVAILKRREAQAALIDHAEELENIVLTRTKQLAHAERLASLGTFAAGMAHEINNPNSFISGNISFLKQFWEVALPLLQKHQKEDTSRRVERFSDEVEKSLDGILDGSQRISKIVDSLKTYSKGGMETDKVECRLSDPVHDAKNLLRHRLKKGIQLVITIPNQIVAVCDRQQMSQVFVNLLNNAMDAMEESGMTQEKRITVSAELLDDHIWVRVKDNGPGIPDEAVGKIFDPFYTSKGKTKGTGLGLSIVHGIIKDHAGQITVYSSSDPNEETEFLIILPNCEIYKTIIKTRKKNRRKGDRRLNYNGTT